MKNFLRIVSFAAALFAMATPVSAQLKWGTGGNGGSGTWDSSTANWYNGTSNTSWLPGGTGTFAGTSGTVTVSGTQTASQLTFSSATGAYTLVTTTSTLAGASGNLTIEADSDASINTQISASGTLTKTGTGTLSLGPSAQSTVAGVIGGLSIQAGTVSFVGGGSNSFLNYYTGTMTLGVAGTSSGTFAYTPTGSINFGTFEGNVTVQGNGNDTISISGTGNVVTLMGTVSIQNTTLTVSSSSQFSAGSISFKGPILATGNSTLNVNSTIAALFSTADTIASVNISSGTLLLMANGVLPTNAEIALNGNSSSLTFGLNSSAPISQTIASITGSQSSQIANDTTTGISNLTINNNSADTFGGRIGIGFDLQPYNNLSITKTGTGVLTLTGTNNMYNGGTMVMSGTLIVANTSGSATGSGTVSVSNGATLGGSGTINSSNITISGKVQAGMSGTDTTSVLTMTTTGSIALNNANLVFNLNAATPGQGNELVLGATPSVLFSTSTLTLNLQNSGIIPDGTEYLLLTSTGTGTGIGNSIFGGDLSLSGSNVISGLNLTINGGSYGGSYLELVPDGSGYDIAVIVAVPEPGVWLLLLGGFGILGFCRIRKWRNL